MASSYYSITVRNLSLNTQYFYVFQKRATFQPPVSAASVLCSSLGCQSVGNYQNTGAQISFALGTQIYVGAISTAPPLPPSQFMTFIATKTLQLPVESTKAMRPISLTSATSNSTLNCTNLTTNPLGMSQPANQSGIPVGAFGVNVPPYTPTPTPELYCGVAAIIGDGSMVLSSFIAPTPNDTTTCAPQQIFFVKAGYVLDGDVIPYDESKSACCDFTTGYTRITVDYNADGTFSTTSGP